MKRRAITTITTILFLASMIAVAIPVAAESTLIWQIGEFEPSALGYSLTEQVDEFWAVRDINYEFTFTVDPMVVNQDASSFPRGLASTGKVNIVFEVTMTGTFELTYSRFGSETDDIYVDGTLVASITGFGDGPGTDFMSLISFDLDTVGTHTISIVTYGGDIGAHWFEALALEHASSGSYVDALIDIDPDTLNLKSKGKWITCYIQLPEGFNVEEIDVNTVLLEHEIPVEWGDIQDGVLMVKFARAAVIEYIRDVLGVTEGEVTLTVTGRVAGTLFIGTDTITVIQRGHK